MQPERILLTLFGGDIAIPKHSSRKLVGPFPLAPHEKNCYSTFHLSVPAARGGKAKRDEGKTKFSTSSPLDDHTARLWRALICPDFYVHSLSSDKERTKKADQGA